MLLIEKIFKNNILFLAFLAFIYGGVILIISEIIHHENVEHEVRGHVLKELKRMKADHATKELVKERTQFRWHSYDMRIWCNDAEETNFNIGWSCPNIDEVLDLTKKKYEDE